MTTLGPRFWGAVSDREESFWLRHMYPVAVLEDRYGGTYSGGLWLAIADWEQQARKGGYGNETRYEYTDNRANGSDPLAMAFGRKLPWWVAVGPDPSSAVDALLVKAHKRYDRKRTHSVG